MCPSLFLHIRIFYSKSVLQKATNIPSRKMLDGLQSTSDFREVIWSKHFNVPLRYFLNSTFYRFTFIFNFAYKIFLLFPVALSFLSMNIS